MAERGSEANWAHIMWQRHGVPFERFINLSYREKVAYLASEILESEKPVRQAPALFGRGGG